MLKNEKFNIFEIAKKNNFKRFAYFKVTLRDKIKYDIELIDGNIKFSDKTKERHVVFACQTFSRTNQIVPPKYNTDFLTYNFVSNTYSYETTTIDILLECSDSDYKKFADDITNKKHEYKLYELLEFFTYKYNLASSGNDFINTCELCVGCFNILLFYRDKKTGEYEQDKGVITPLSVIKSNSDYELNFQKVVNNEIPAWKFFVNKTKFNYLICNNLDCVINAAIAIESYVIFLIKQSGKYDHYVKEYTNKLGFQSAIKFSVDNSIINSNMSDIIINGYSKIGIYRSLIIHGVIDSPIIDREQAKKAYETIVDIFSSINQELYDEKGLLVPDIYFENDYNMMKGISEDYENGNYEAAITKLNYNIENDIFKDISIFNRGKCYIALERRDEAINDFKECIANRYRMIESYIHLGIQLSILKKYKEAKEVYLQAIKLEANYSGFYCSLGIVQQFLKEYDSAIYNLNKALSIDKKPFYFFSLASIYCDKKDFATALLNINCAVRIDSNNCDFLYFRALLYIKLKKLNNAERDVVKCLNLYQNRPNISLILDCIFKIGILWKKEKKYKDAIRMFNRAIRIDNNVATYYLERSKCYKLLGLKSKAQKDYLKYLEFSSK